MSLDEVKEAIAGLPPSELVELTKWLENRRASEKRKLPEFEPVPYERIADLSGVLKDGPTDLARNKHYLEGLGEHPMR